MRVSVHENVVGAGVVEAPPAPGAGDGVTVHVNRVVTNPLGANTPKTTRPTSAHAARRRHARRRRARADRKNVRGSAGSNGREHSGHGPATESDRSYPQRLQNAGVRGFVGAAWSTA